MKSLLPYAADYVSQGLSVIPLLGKRPAENWQYYQENRPTDRQLKLWWALYKQANVGIVTGKISNLIVIDFDHDAKLIYPKSFPLIKKHLGKEFVISKTGKGFHCIIKASGIRNIKVARENKRVLIETRGEGGYIVAPPSIHPDYKTIYEFTNCKRIGDIKESNPENVNGLLLALNEKFDKSEQTAVLPARCRQVESGDVLVVDDIDRYVGNILKFERERLSNAAAGERNSMLYKAAAAVWSLSDYLDEAAIYETLLTSCNTNGLLRDDGARAVMQTIKSAMRVDKRKLDENPFVGMGLPEAS